MNGQAVISRGVALVTPVFGAFGGFLTNIAPPDDGPGSVAGFAVGVAAFGGVAILLFVMAFSQGWSRKKRRKVWLPVAGVCFLIGLPSSLAYNESLGQKTMVYPAKPEHGWRRTKGSQLQDAAKDLLKIRADQSIGDADLWLVRQLAGGRNEADFTKVWTRESIDTNRTSLTRWYTGIALLLAGTLISLAEGVLVVPKRPKRCIHEAV